MDAFIHTLERCPKNTWWCTLASSSGLPYSLADKICLDPTQVEKMMGSLIDRTDGTAKLKTIRGSSNGEKNLILGSKEVIKDFFLATSNQRPSQFNNDRNKRINKASWIALGNPHKDVCGNWPQSFPVVAERYKKPTKNRRDSDSFPTNEKQPRRGKRSRLSAPRAMATSNAGSGAQKKKVKISYKVQVEDVAKVEAVKSYMKSTSFVASLTTKILSLLYSLLDRPTLAPTTLLWVIRWYPEPLVFASANCGIEGSMTCGWLYKSVILSR